MHSIDKVHVGSEVLYSKGSENASCPHLVLIDSSNWYIIFYQQTLLYGTTYKLNKDDNKANASYPHMFYHQKQSVLMNLLNKTYTRLSFKNIFALVKMLEFSPHIFSIRFFVTLFQWRAVILLIPSKQPIIVINKIVINREHTLHVSKIDK